ncbi:MAG TPA: hypothetical protein ENK78_03325 [Thiothrix sp.]|nr:hypothetical protein [Thiothrix sp.]
MVPVSFVTGAVMGVAATFVYKDEGVKQWFKDTGSSVSNTVTGLFKKKEQPVEVVDNVEKANENSVVVEGTAEEVKEGAAKAEEATTAKSAA